MFWKFDLHTTSHMEQLLEREDVTLHELMEEEDVLQECKAQNRRLLLFLSQDHCMQELVSLITEEPPADLEEKLRFKFPNIACELLTSDVGMINDKLGGDEALLEKLYHFLEKEPPLNPLLASFFSKTIGNLIARKTEQVISFLRKKHSFISLVLTHIDASAMMDLLLRLISCVEPAPLRQEVLNWLNDERLIQRLTELIHTGRDEERQSNASQTLCDIIRLSRDQANQLAEAAEPDPLLAVLESQENVSALLKSMFEADRTDVSVVNGTQVLLTLLESRRTGLEGLMDLCSQGSECAYSVSSSVLRALEPHLKDFQQLLLDPPKKSAILTTVGVLEQPLGNARLQVARLVAALLQTNDGAICQELCQLSIMDKLLDLFFKYTWNNFLHFQVELCVASILNHSAHGTLPPASQQNHEDPPPKAGPQDPPHSPANETLVAHLFQQCRLMQRILDAWEENDKIQVEGGARRGYMGHLTRIANTVVQNLEKVPVQSQIRDLIKELPEDCRGRWETFVGETLRETNRKNTVDLVSTHNLHSSSEDDDMESPFPNDLSIQQAFSDYQIQQMTANFVDQFGFNDEEFSEHDENINATFDRIAEINFNVEADDSSASAAAFEACCKERIQQFDDCEDEEDIWEDKEINYAKQVKSRSRFGVSLSSNSTSKTLKNGGQGRGSASDEDRVEEEEEAEPEVAAAAAATTVAQGVESVESQSPGWTADFGEVDVSGSSSSWGSSEPSTADTNDTGWANFTEFQPFCSSESSDTGPPANQTPEKTSSPGGVWEVCEGRKAPLVASDSSSSGGSDSEEEVEDARGDKTAAKSEVQVPLEKLSVSGGNQKVQPAAGTSQSPSGATPSSATENITVTDRNRIDSPSPGGLTPNGPV
ncbi:serine/threonine-protein phosphatase 6 regulatory subunit 2a isoform X3 [Denticeps clupeoides]|uniref:serine/threonine-protein phosphatase 6 regulatory subunit 2a isoform X3 n=1 Tax=Denticeps clupeoides TaxID=299321 RepID=UPI0010A5389F|nr:serine/threonine-protein phosphatase 6 regulatory subunit 2 isoform X3 [Denticeps clupeoides]